MELRFSSAWIDDKEYGTTIQVNFWAVVYLGQVFQNNNIFLGLGHRLFADWKKTSALSLYVDRHYAV